MTLFAWTTIATTIAVSAWFTVVAWRAGSNIKDARTFYSGTGLAASQYDDTYLATNATFTAVLLLLAEVGFQLRWWALAAPVAWVVGMAWSRRLFLRSFLPAFQEDRQPQTLHEFCGVRYRWAALRRALAGVTILAFVGTVAVEAVGLLYAFVRFGVGYRPLIPAMLILVLILLVFYARKSGFPGVVATDKYQAWLILLCYAALITIGLIVCFDTHGPAQSSQPTTAVTTTQSVTPTAAPGLATGLVSAIGFVILFLPFQFCVSDMWQRCYAVNWNPDIIRRIASLRMMILFAIVFTIPIGLGIIAAETGFAPSTGSFLLLDVCYAVISALPTPLAMLLIVCLFAGFAAGVLSTADTLLVNAGYIFQYDWRSASADDRPAVDLSSVRESVLVMGVAAILLLGPEMLSDRITLIDISYAVFSNQVAFAPILLLAVFGTVRARAVPARTLVIFLLCSVVVCVLTALLGALAGDKRIRDAAPILGTLTTFVGVIVYIIQGVVRKPSAIEH